MSPALRLSPEEERIYRAYRLGVSDGRGSFPGGRGLDVILPAIRSDSSLEPLLETLEQRLERQLAEERVALRAFRERVARESLALDDEPEVC